MKARTVGIVLAVLLLGARCSRRSSGSEENTPPIARNDSTTTTVDTTVVIAVLYNDSDPDDDALAIDAISVPASGTATIDGDTVLYSPAPGMTGSDEFTYTIVDEHGATATATVTVTVTAEQLTTSITQHGITWFFESPVTYGQFANGDYWVLGPVTIIRIAPDTVVDVQRTTEECAHYTHCTNLPAPYQGQFEYTGHCIDDHCEYAVANNGWEVNPEYDLIGNVGHQGFDGRIAIFDESLLSDLPYVAGGGESIVKAVSLTGPDSDCSTTGNNCLSTAAVLTVVSEIPPDYGLTVFRPPYVGNDKPYYSVNDLRTDLLPSYARVDSAPSLEWVAERFRMVQMNHEPGNTGRKISPIDNFQDPARYGPNVGIANDEGVLALMLDDPIEEKMPALICYVQAGLDWLYSVQQGKDWTVGGPGVQPGFKIVPAFGALMLDDTTLMDVVANTLFNENHYLKSHVLVPSRGLYGTDQGYFTERGYWEYVSGEGSSSAQMDPYGYVDGEIPRLAYAINGIPGPFKGEALAVQLMPELRPIWNHDQFLDYMDRRVNIGMWTQPDPCAPYDGDMDNYGITFGPDGNGGCILDDNTADGVGRFPDLHGSDVNGGSEGGYASEFINEMWTTHRTESCYDGMCNSNETAQTCPYDCI